MVLCQSCLNLLPIKLRNYFKFLSFLDSDWLELGLFPCSSECIGANCGRNECLLGELLCRICHRSSQAVGKMDHSVFFEGPPEQPAFACFQAGWDFPWQFWCPFLCVFLSWGYPWDIWWEPVQSLQSQVCFLSAIWFYGPKVVPGHVFSFTCFLSRVFFITYTKLHCCVNCFKFYRQKLCCFFVPAFGYKI